MATEMNFWTRLQSESPKFFVRIQNIAIYLAASSTAIIGALAAIPDFTTPSWVTKIYSYLMVASVIAGIVAKTPIKDPVDNSTNFEKPAAPKDGSL
jgi:hypothetical protein